MAQFKGYAFPFQKSSTAAPTSAVPPRLFVDSIKQILLTEQGERVMRPDFGTHLRRKLFENINKGLVSDIQKEILSALTKWESRIQVQTIDVRQEANAPSLVTVTVTFVALGKLSTTGPVEIGAP